MPNRRLIAIIDKVTNDIVGPIMLHRHSAPAIRVFDTVARMDNSQVGQHIQDHELWQLAELDDDTLEITANKILIITGTSWVASQPPTETAE